MAVLTRYPSRLSMISRNSRIPWSSSTTRILAIIFLHAFYEMVWFPSAGKIRQGNHIVQVVPFPAVTLNIDFPSVSFQNPADHRQSQPRPHIPRRIERFKNLSEAAILSIPQPVS